MYDHALTFLDEVELVWPAPWGAGKILFLLTRYMTWPELLSGLIRGSAPSLCVSELETLTAEKISFETSMRQLATGSSVTTHVSSVLVCGWAGLRHYTL